MIHEPKTFADFMPTMPKLHNLALAVKNRTIPKHLLISGDGGLGKSVLAKLIAVGINCEAESPPCGICDLCKENWNISFDIRHVDGFGFVPKRDLSSIVDFLCQVPMRLHTRVLILDNADYLDPNTQHRLINIIDQANAEVILCARKIEYITPRLRTRLFQIELSRLDLDSTLYWTTRLLERNTAIDPFPIAVAANGIPENIVKLIEIKRLGFEG